MSVLNWLQAVERVAPIILPFVPGFPQVLTPFIIAGIHGAESMPGATSDQKLAAAVDQVNNGVAALNAVKPGTVDASAVNSAVVTGINAVVAAANAVKSIK